ncbi:unnamed protein product [Eruca vesicaria subsp. sativa]|uniref:Uncharacterized protein n=1 Tax=Eruca vesicaria subsp. sativa TaxID=29727 RepID=A0ABC8J454_ERUVS|nr:unnamed protein product [Eruca vesicaria subsp. sativa]
MNEHGKTKVKQEEIESSDMNVCEVKSSDKEESRDVYRIHDKKSATMREFDLNKIYYEVGELHPDKEIEETILFQWLYNELEKNK